MSRSTTKLTRLAVVGLSVGALLPATAAAMPINDGQAAAQPAARPTTLSTGGGDVVSGGGYVIGPTPSKPFTGGGDVVSGGGYQIPKLPATGVTGPPVFPTNTTSLPRPGASTSDGGIDTGVLVALGVGILVALGAGFLAVATKRRTRERQAA
jgi:hypothetical protein